MYMGFDQTDPEPPCKLEEAEATGMTRQGKRLRETGGWQHRPTAIAPGDDIPSTRSVFEQPWCSTFKGATARPHLGPLIDTTLES